MEILMDLKEDWDIVIYFDGSRCEKSWGASGFFVTPQGVPIHYYFKLYFSCTNYDAKYEALILAIKTPKKSKLKKVKFIGDSLIIVNQVKGIF